MNSELVIRFDSISAIIHVACIVAQITILLYNNQRMSKYFSWNNQNQRGPNQ